MNPEEPHEDLRVYSGGHLANLQSEAMCPAPPHLVHTVVLVMLRVSVLCHGLRMLERERGRGYLGVWGGYFEMNQGGGTPLTGYHPPAGSR